MNLTVDIRAESILARIAGTTGAMMGRLVREVQRLSIALQSHVKSDKLTGQVLHVRSGTLRRSVNRKVEQTETSVTAIVGTNIRYARPHEFGFQGTVSVPGHSRQTSGGQSVPVRAHTRRVNMPVRSFLRSALADMERDIRADLRGAATRDLLGSA